MPVEVVPYSDDWPTQFQQIAQTLRSALAGVDIESIEHVGSTSVPGLAAKPVLDIDVIVQAESVVAAISALETVGYRHLGDLGVSGREAFVAPDAFPERHVYLCTGGTLPVRNHLAVRDVLRSRPDLRDEYADVKVRLASDPRIDIDSYIAAKSAVLRKVLHESDLSEIEREQIWQLNNPSG